MGVAGGQSTFVRHVTQSPVRGLHRGAAVPQFAFDRHATHCAVVGSQSGCGVPAQSRSALHPTQAPSGAHFGAVFGQEAAVHAAWHW
jgi:hypothetical protein